MTTTVNIFESKFGFHPCDRETYKKLKKVRYYLHIERQQQSALKRWSAKLPHNRKRRICTEVYTDKNGKHTPIYEVTEWNKPQVCPINLHLFSAEYRKALPQSNPEHVKQLSLSLEQIDSFVEQAELWLKSIGKENR